MDEELEALLQPHFNKILKTLYEHFKDMENNNKKLMDEIEQLKLENIIVKKSEMWSQLNKKNEEIQKLQNEINFLKKNKIEKKEIINNEIIKDEAELIPNNSNNLLNTFEIDENTQIEKKKKKNKENINDEIIKKDDDENENNEDLQIEKKKKKKKKKTQTNNQSADDDV